MLICSESHAMHFGLRFLEMCIKNVFEKKKLGRGGMGWVCYQQQTNQLTHRRYSDQISRCALETVRLKKDLHFVINYGIREIKSRN